MPKPTTLNRFPLFGLFAHQAARHMGYPEDDARLLGYSTALLYAIFKAKAQAKKEKAEKEPAKKELPTEIAAKMKMLQFGGQEFQVIYGKGKKLKQTVVGHEVHDAEEYDSQIKAKFPEGWYDRLAKAFDKSTILPKWTRACSISTSPGGMKIKWVSIAWTWRSWPRGLGNGRGRDQVSGFTSSGVFERNPKSHRWPRGSSWTCR